MKLKDKVCIVTGAASGIGKEIAFTYAREGGRVVIADLNKDAAQAVANEITKAGGTAMSVAMDVTSEEQVNAAVAEVVAAYGGVDVLVSNAGIQIVHPIEAFPFADWKNCLRSTSTAPSSPPKPACRTCTPQARAVASSTWDRYTRRKPRF